MSTLTHIEKQKLERELGMPSGYVLDFSNRTFDEFFKEVLGVDIYDDTFNRASGSKAHRMRAFWDKADDSQIIALLEGLSEAWDIYARDPMSEECRALFEKIVNRLSGAAEQTFQNNPKGLSRSDFEALYSRLIKLSEWQPQARGFEFERFLNDLFKLSDMAPRPSFRLVGEQIDGSFELYKETYLLEAKWQDAPLGNAPLHTFEGKLREKASWTRGLFVSVSGFSPDGLESFGRGKRTICMDGFDLSEILSCEIQLEKALSAKIRKAAETGKPYVPIRELYL